MSQSSPITPPVALTIAGFDPSSGAGITADIQVFAAHGIYGTACITALTVQSTQGVVSVSSSANLIAPTLENLDADFPLAGIKIGMLGSVEAVRAVAAYLRVRPPGSRGPVVLDPVISSSSGASLLSSEGLAALQTELLPLVDWVTPNTAELMELSGVAVDTVTDVEPAMRALASRYPNLYIVGTGGHLEPPVDSLLTPEGVTCSFDGECIDTTSTHGSGCAFSAALLSRLVLGYAPQDAVGAAKTYVTEALRRAPGLGKGHGPLHLLWPLAPLELRRTED